MAHVHSSGAVRIRTFKEKINFWCTCGCYRLFFLKLQRLISCSFFFLCVRKDEKKKKKLTMPEAVTVLVCYLGSTSSKCANTNSKISEETPELLKLTEKWRSSAPIVGRFRGKDMLKTYYYIFSFSLDATFPRTSRHIFSWRDQDSTKGNLNVVQWIERESSFSSVTTITSSGISPQPPSSLCLWGTS